MAINAIEWAFEQELDSPTAKLVLIALADHADKHGHSWPSAARLARRTSLHRASIFRAVDYLTAAGLVQQVARKGQSNVYNLAFHPSQAATPDPSHAATPPVAESDTPRRTVRHPPSQAATRTVNEPSKNRHLSEGDQPLPEGWQPDAGLLTWAKERAPHVDTDEETAKFITYFEASTGHQRRDWPAVWRNWIMRARKDYTPGATPFPTRMDRQRARNNEKLDAFMAGREQASASLRNGQGPQLRIVGPSGKRS